MLRVAAGFYLYLQGVEGGILVLSTISVGRIGILISARKIKYLEMEYYEYPEN